MARASKGVFVLRIEDIDPTRCTQDFEVSCLRDLRWLGIDWDEGPDVEGPFAQARSAFTTTLPMGIVHAKGAALPCHCTPTKA